MRRATAHTIERNTTALLWTAERNVLWKDPESPRSLRVTEEVKNMALTKAARMSGEHH